MKKSTLLMGLLVLGVCNLEAETTITRETMEGKSSLITTVITRSPEGNLIRESVESKEGSSSNLVAQDGSLREMIFKIAEGSGTLRSDGKTLTYDITYQGKPLKGTTDLQGLPWYGNFERGLKQMIKSRQDRLVFASVSLADPGKVNEMEFVREGTEKIGNQEAHRVKVSLTGMMSMFWSAQFWVSTEGRILRYKGNYGPGTPERLLELVRVEG